MIAQAIEIAKRVRARCEDVANKTNRFGSDLSCMCGVASYALRQALRKEGIPAQLVWGEYLDYAEQPFGSDHCWVSVGNRIIDITATQYGIKRNIHVVSIANYHYRSQMVVRSIPKFFREWPPEQRPHKRMLRKILT